MGISSGQSPRAFSRSGNLIGLLAGVMASSVAALIGWVIIEQVMDLSYEFNLWLWVVGIAAGVGGVLIAGKLATRPVLNQLPIAVLQSQV